MRSTGAVRAKVLFVDFPDAEAVKTPQQLADLLAPTVHDFFDAVSYGAMDLQLAFHLTWLRMSQGSSHDAAAIKTYAGHRDWIK
ncbi:MAG: hypothetical protein H6747_05535 [Deltaproteobacteria bacterium]|nr:hypothetical protein [Deltaproteobacteria bacterium]